jgi:DeoR/GlpR family transcriptional regulator of sugar metabolism
LGSKLALKAALRHDTIRRAIEVTGQVSTADLKGRLGVTEVTIREDLKHLESKGVFERLRGGAVASRSGTMEMPFEETSTTNRAEKKAIGARAASMVPNDQTVIIDVGSTTTEMAKALLPDLSRVVVITNSNIAEAEIKQAMVRSAGETTFLADHDKIGHVVSAFVTDISGADLLITDAGADASVLSNLEGDGLAIEVVRPNAK